MEQWIAWFYEVLNAALQLYFRQECAVSSVYEIASSGMKVMPLPLSTMRIKVSMLPRW